MTKLNRLTVGSSVFLNVNNAPREFIVVNQGIPSNSALYDSSCDGTWLLQKYTPFAEEMDWHDGDSGYPGSDIHKYLNSDFFNLFDSDVQSIIKSVKIPHFKSWGYNSSFYSGSNGLNSKIFLLSCTEVGFGSVSTNSNTYEEGATLEYFSDGDASKRQLQLSSEGSLLPWWLRTPNTTSTYAHTHPNAVGINGGPASYAADAGQSSNVHVRPALILPFDISVESDGTIVTSTFNGRCNENGALKEITTGFVNVNGVLKEISSAYMNVNGTLKEM